MNVVFIGLVFSILVSLVVSFQIFPLANPDAETAAKTFKMKYSGLTAGLLPGATKPSSLQLLETAEGAKKESFASPAKDLLPPKLGGSSIHHSKNK